MADSKEIIKCPACNKDMEKIFMPEAGVNLDVCLNGCGGIYFDNRELEKFDEKQENIDALLEQIEGKKFNPVNDNELRICPACGMPMAKMGAADGEVIIDVCHTCGAKFLDNGELQKIRKYKNDTEKMDTIINGILDAAYSERYGNAKPSSIRKFFEDIVKRYI